MTDSTLTILSPVDMLSETTFEREVPSKRIIEDYRQFNIDVSRFFVKIPNVSIHRCKGTGYRFYYPFNISGDSDFYSHFQQYDWYYMQWKWEHQVCMEFISNRQAVLEVGCGEGAFLKKLYEQKAIEGIGLELNSGVAGKKEGFEIINEKIESFSKKNRESFDLVCSFQVLEHISEVHSFLSAQILCLKPGGIMVFSVPNNKSFAGKIDHALNLPPHHMGLWDHDSIMMLAKKFDLNFREVRYEPLQKYHYDSFIASHLKTILGKYGMKIGLKLLRVGFVRRSVFKLVEKFGKNLKGHTILAVFEKKK